MARTVTDLALFLEALSGGDTRTPVSLNAQPGDFYPLTSRTDASVPGRRNRVAWSPDLNGAVTVSREVLAALEPVVARLGDLGWEVEAVTPDLSAAVEAFTTLRALQMHAVLGPVVHDHPEMIKQDARWNSDQGAALDGPTIARAHLVQGKLMTTLREFFESYDLLITPTCQVIPFPITSRYPREIDGVPMNNYLEWMQLPSATTVTGCPSISLPAAFSSEGLPVGLQFLGPRQGERTLLNLALQFERLFGVGDQVPIIRGSSVHSNFVEVD